MRGFPWIKFGIHLYALKLTIYNNSICVYANSFLK